MKNFVSFLTLFSFLGICTVASSQKPQEPKEPFNYSIENINFVNSIDSVSLAGTLTFPKGKTNFPTVILISGSGPQDRNSEIFGHKPFWVIADHLTKNGIAVLRVDDRGAGESTGNYNTSTLDGFKRDTEAALVYLKTRKDINHKKIGLLGHSLGGVIAPMIAADNSKVEFVVLMAAPGIRGDKLMLSQKAIIERKMGVSEMAVEAGQKNIEGAFKIIVESDLEKEQLVIALKEYFKSVFGAALPENQAAVLSRQLAAPWLADFIKFDPAKALVKVKCPVLAINGLNDTQVPAKENLSAIKASLEKGGNSGITIKEFTELNHLLQTSKTGMPQEYGGLQETISPLILEEIVNWINKQH